ncbi:MAG: YfiR family protein [Rhodocyclaceae bacterium]|nr:YfiR family protein [Rhodocyclaceae bacterium]
MAIFMMTGGRWRRALLAIVLLLPTIASAVTPSEESVKAGFVLNFAKYTEWPAAFMGGGELKVCWLGPQALSGKLAELTGARVQGFVVRGRQVVRPEEWRDCHVLFIPASEASRLSAVLGALTTPTLTVSDSPDFVQSGGMIGLSQRAGRIRFDVNLAAAHKVRLSLSSQVLKLADEVLQ